MKILKPLLRYSLLSLTIITLYVLSQARALAQDPIKVGLIVPLSGPWAKQGQMMRIAAELAVDNINTQGGIISIGGRPLELVVFDTGDSVERAKNAAQRMVAEEPDMVAATGSYLSSFTLAVTEVTERSQLPLLTLSYSDLITDRGFNYIFQTSATGAYQSENALPILLEMAENASGERPQTIAVIMDNTAASVAFTAPIRDGNVLAELGLELVVDEVFTPPLANATPLIQKLRASRPDLLLLLPTAVSDAKLLLEKMNEFGLGRGRLPTISNGGAMGDPGLKSNMPAALLEGVMSIVANWGIKGQEELMQDFNVASGEPWMAQHPISAYGHIWVIKEALEQAGAADNNAVADALHSMDITNSTANYFPGNSIRFDVSGKRVDAELLVIQWQDGEAITVFPEDVSLGQINWPTN